MRRLKTVDVGLIVAAMLAACTGDSSTPTSTSPPVTSPPPTIQPLAVTDLDSFVKGLELAGHEVEIDRHEDWANDIFGVRGYSVSFDGTRLMAFDYPSKSAATRLQESVSKDGYYIGSTVIDWGGQHLYRAGSLIVVYLGERAGSIRTLEDLLGSQFAPRS
ncbi:MAG: hypothetical protein WEF05_03820 [Actinomycetota bacterium]